MSMKLCSQFLDMLKPSDRIKRGDLMDYTLLGQRIKEERIKLNLTQAELAEDINISDTYMSQIETGKRSLTLDTLVILVNRLGVSIDYIMKDFVKETDENSYNQIRQIIDSQSNENKQLAIDLLKTIFAHIGDKKFPACR